MVPSEVVHGPGDNMKIIHVRILGLQTMSSSPQLYWVGPDGKENVFHLLADEVLIGRKGDADVVLSNQHISRHHARLVKREDGYFLEDLGSTNGTFINETRV